MTELSSQQMEDNTFVYDCIIDPDAENNTHAFSLAMIGHNKRVLEVGCATGYFTKALAERGCKVVGMELDSNAAHLAERWAERVVQGDIERLDLWEQVEDEAYDVVTFGDVLEHLRDPLAILRAAVRKLKPSGFIVSSIPNFAHGDVRLALLHGKFQYRELGLLDRTHLRFFTLQTIHELFRNAGLIEVETQRVVMPLFNTELRLKPEEFSESVLDEIRTDVEHETYQFVVKCVIDNGLTATRTLAARLSELNDAIQEVTVENRLLKHQLVGPAGVQDERDRLSDRVNELTFEVEDLRAQLEHERELSTQSAELVAALETAVDALQTAFSDSEKRYGDILNSTSFRITAPLRRFRRP